MRPDEAALWAAVLDGEFPRVAGERLGMHHKRVDFLCGKWSSRGEYDYGTTVDLGWVTPLGRSRPRSNS